MQYGTVKMWDLGYISAEKTPLGTHRWLDYAVLTYAESLVTKAMGKRPEVKP